MKILNVFCVLLFLWMSATLVTDAVWDGRKPHLFLTQVATHKILGIRSHFSLKRFHASEAFRSVGNRWFPACLICTA